MRKVSVIAITATYLDMTFAITANITSVVETGGYFVRTVICTIILASFPMSHADDMRGEPMNEFLQALAKIIEQYGGVVLTIGLGTFVVTFLLCLLIFILVLKSLWDEDRKWKK